MPLRAADFESAVSAIPPLGRVFALGGHDATQYRCGVVQFAVGLIVGASVAGLLIIVFAPSRRVRAEKPLPRDAETKVLLGEDPDDPTFPPASSDDHPQPYSSADLAQLRRLGEQQKRRR
jgi:hypothetical protein